MDCAPVSVASELLTDRLPQLETLEAVVSTGFTFPGMSQLLARWMIELVGPHECLLELRPSPSRVYRLIGCIRGEEPEIHVAPDAVVFESHWKSAEAEDHDGFSMRTPIVHHNQSLGRICVSRTDRDFADVERQAFRKLVSQFAFLLHYQLRMEQAGELAHRDPLTGLYNRRYLHQQLEHWIPRAKKERLPISLFLLDVDHFKSINDTWGHDVGDRVLRLLGGLMNSLFRTDDVVCRFGGEEFAILLCDNREGGCKDHPTEVLSYAERLRKAAESLPLSGDDGRALANITISGGIATFPWDANSAEDLLRKADQALYRAKRNGRNRIYFAAPRDTSKAG